MTRRQLNFVVLLPLLCLLAVLFTIPAQADNRAFLSTSLETSQASYLLEISPAVGGTVDKLRLQFPAGMLGSSVGLVSMLINGKPAKSTTLTTVDPVDPNVLIIDVPKTTAIKAGVKVILELMGLTNPIAGDGYHIDISLIGKKANVIEALTPIPLSIAPLLSGSGPGDITAVIAGTGLSGGGTTGDVTLDVNTAVIQKRVAGTCAAGNAIQSIDATGNVVCQSAGGVAGDITAVIAGAGLAGGATSGDATLNVANLGVTNAMLANNSVDSGKIVDGSVGSADVNPAQLQLRVTGTCATGNAIRVVAQDGTVICESVGSGGGVAAVTASAPLASTGGATPNISLPSVIIESSNTAIGSNALVSNTTGVNNSASGAAALFKNTTGSGNTASGVNALLFNTTGSNNTASGLSTLASNTQGNFNTATGDHALSGNTTGSGNTASGAGALQNNSTGGANTASGTFALQNNTTGVLNTATGANALQSNTTGSSNTASGENALQANTTGGGNTASGVFALSSNTTGNANTASGTIALQNNTTGFNNTAIGADALSDNTTGKGNTASGALALEFNITGDNNTAVGLEALLSNITGFNNTAVGTHALQNNTTVVLPKVGALVGHDNTAVGLNALLSNTTGNSNTALGAGADVSADNLDNATAIGFGAVVNVSNNIRLGNAAIAVIEGQVAFTASSDKTKKENFQPVDGEEVLKKLRAFNLTSWNFIGHDPEKFRHYGPMAQDFFAAFGRDEVGKIGTPTTINSGDIAGILMVAVQALEKRTAEIKEKEARIAVLEKEANELKAKQSFFKTIAARFEALELRLNHPVQVRAETTLDADTAELKP
jgi:hypothetical protein